MKALKYLAIIILCTAFGFFVAYVLYTGILGWELISSPSKEISQYLPTDLNQEYKTVEPCDYSAVEFSKFSNAPKNIVDCTKVRIQWPEGVDEYIYAKDISGRDWQWVHSTGMGGVFSLLCFPVICFFLGIIVCIVINILNKQDIKNEKL